MTARAPRTAGSHPHPSGFSRHRDGRGACAPRCRCPASISIGGQTDYRAVLRMTPEPARERTLELQLEPRRPRARSCPAPLTKPAAAAMPTSVAVQWPASGDEEIRVDLGSVLRGAVMLDSDANGPKLGRSGRHLRRGRPGIQRRSDGQCGRQASESWTLPGGSRSSGGCRRTSSGRPRRWRPTSRRREDSRSADRLSGLSFIDVPVGDLGSQRRLAHRADGPNVVGIHLAAGRAQNPPAPWDLEFERLKFTDARDCGTRRRARRRRAISGRSAGNPMIRAVSRRSLSMQRS